jgi:hypothetical protein
MCTYNHCKQVEITVLDESVNFGAVKYMCEAQSSYWLENTGDAIAYYRLYSSRAPARPLSATPRYVVLTVFTYYYAIQ